MENKSILDISWGTIFKISVTVIFLYFLYLIREIIIWFIFALVISILMEPAVGLLSRRKVPRVVAVVTVYALIFGLIGYFLYLVLPFFISEIQHFSEVFPQQLKGYFQRVSPLFSKFGIEAFENLDAFLQNVKKPFQEMGRNVFSSIISLFGGVLAAFFTISLSVFLSLEKDLMEKGLAVVFPKKYEEYLFNLWRRSKQKVTGWFLMRIIGVIFVGIASYISFQVLDVEYPVSLAAIGGIFDFVPIIGPSVAGILIFAVVSLDSLLKASFVLAVFGLIQVIENTIVLPVLARKMIKIPPVLVLVALFIGGKLWGVMGAILLVPLVAILFEFLKDFLSEKREEIFSSYKSEEEPL
ncbi:AI-2E family transporter [bacterium]|nr:AI-2E family transporter [bacterium]